MNIVILGAGQVGGSLAENLVAENHEITLVDTNIERLNQLQDRLDLRVVVGRCSYPDTLRQAGADEADMIIAVTDSDESNMVACQVAYSLFQVPTKIARIRSQHYFIRKELFGIDNLPIDVFISPENLVTHNISQLVTYPGALQVLDFAEGIVKLVALKPYHGGTLLGKKIQAINELLPDIKVRIVAVFREGHSVTLDENTTIESGDEIFFITTANDVALVMSALQQIEQSYKRILIAGGGNIGARLARHLQMDYQVKVIEPNRARCEHLAETLESVIVLHGDCCDRELLLNENIEHSDVFCALTNDDETNIIACLQAKRLGVKQVMALITRTAYVDLIEGGPINIALSPQNATVSSILKHLRRGDVVNVYSLRRGAAEAIEAIAHGDKKTSKVVGRHLVQIKLPKGTTIGAIVRQEEIIMPEADTFIQADDHVILFVADKKHIRDVEKLFQVSAGFF